MKSLNFARLLGFLILASTLARGNPHGEQVTSGSVTFTREGANLVIQQGSDKAIIHWQDFSIAAGELTKFVQPSSLSATLNRVTSGIPSGIHGSLEANGNIFLINPAGILIGPTGVINTNSFIASTRELDDAAFLSGGDLKFVGSSPGDVVNHGTINALGGDVILIGRSVVNTGTINAPNGAAGLAAGDEVLLAAAGDERLFVLAGSGGTAEGVSNAGTIHAAQAELKAAGGNAYALAINNTGIVNATKASREGGRIILRADGGKVRSSGQLNAKGTKGGEIRVQGGEITLAAGSVTDASGDQGGGNVFIGGGFQGALLGGAPNATRTIVEPGALVAANALSGGNAGQIVLWSDVHTGFGGTIHATGGPLGGDGGAVEVSGKQTLAYTGLTNVGAQLGMAGSLLLDPFEVHSFVPPNFPIPGPGAYTSPPGLGSIIDPAALAAALASGHVTLNSDTFISISAAIFWNSVFNLILNGLDNFFDADVVNTGGGSVLTTGVNHIAPGVTVTGLNSLPSQLALIGQIRPGRNARNQFFNPGNGNENRIMGTENQPMDEPEPPLNLTSQIQHNQQANPGGITNAFQVGLDGNGRFVITSNTQTNGNQLFDPGGGSTNEFRVGLDEQGRFVITSNSQPNGSQLFDPYSIDNEKKTPRVGMRRYQLYEHRGIENPIPSIINAIAIVGCYVATSLYGDENAPQLVTLRRLRDEVLLPDKNGREFARWYYTHGEKLAQALKREDAATAQLRHLLDAFVKWLERADWKEARNRHALAAMAEILENTAAAHAGALKPGKGAAARIAQFVHEDMMDSAEGRRFLLWFGANGGGIASGFGRSQEAASVQHALFAGFAAWLEKPVLSRQKRNDAIEVLLEVLGGVAAPKTESGQPDGGARRFIEFASPSAR